MIQEQSTKIKKIQEDQGDLFEDEFDNYPYQEHLENIKRRAVNLYHARDLEQNPFVQGFIRKTSFAFHSDEEKIQESDQVGTPKQLPLAFQIDYIRPLRDQFFDGDEEIDNEDDEQDGPKEGSASGLEKIFNNTPGRIFFVIREEAHEIPFNQENVSDFTKLKVIKKIFKRLIEDVLMHMKGEDKRKTLARMLFNKVDRRQVEKLKKGKNTTQVVENYLKIIEIYDQKYINQAKALLRAGVFNMMNESWIFHKALHIKLRKNEQNQRKARIVFEKYMIKFRNELYEGGIEAFVDREEVLRIPSAIQREGF